MTSKMTVVENGQIAVDVSCVDHRDIIIFAERINSEYSLIRYQEFHLMSPVSIIPLSPA